MRNEELTTQQAADLLGVSQSRIRQMIGAKSLPSTKVGRDHLLNRADVERQRSRPGVGRPVVKGEKR